MRQLEEPCTAHPSYGSQQMSRHLERKGWLTGRRVRQLMRTRTTRIRTASNCPVFRPRNQRYNCSHCGSGIS